ncbi:peptidoglycan-binding protein [Streptomyces anandii]|uniref:peptidoglycan-binding protein n=1 Tax=Streptomyces anandii TaxID=285454 RepID=UPI001E34FDF2|nr:peptidoglycan-binding protein [Streptomyces anandii]
MAAVTAAALGAGHAAPAGAAGHVPARPGAVAGGDDVETPQGEPAPLYGPVGEPVKTGTPAVVNATTRKAILARAKKWISAKVPYSMYAFWPDGYRQDCSGFVSMAWNLPRNEWTGSLARYAVRTTKARLQPGDILLYHNPTDPLKGSHVVLFGGWSDHRHTRYIAYEQAPPRTRRKVTPYAYWSHSSRYVPYRYKGVTLGLAGAKGAPAAAPQPRPAPAPAPLPAPGYPGSAMFGPGAENEYVTRLRERLVAKGYGHLGPAGPGPGWSEADRGAVEAFQRDQGWRGGAADGHPGPETWRRLFA